MPGSSYYDGQSILFTDNVDFSGDAVPTPKVSANGQLIIGSAVSPNLRINTLTQGAGITITNGNGTIEIGATGGGASALTITTDDMTVVSPVTMNWNLAGLGETSTQSSGSPDVQLLSPRVSRWVVDPTLYRGTHQTITAANAAASSGDTIFIRPGTYTEDWTAKAGVGYFAMPGMELSAQTVLKGKITAAFAGTAVFGGLWFETNADDILAITGTAETILRFDNCYFNLTDGDLVTSTTTDTGSFLEFNYCHATITDTGLTYFILDHGTIYIRWSRFFNDSLSTTASVGNNDSSVSIHYSHFQVPINTTGTSSCGLRYVTMLQGGSNTTVLDMSGTGSHEVVDCIIESGTAVAINIDAGTTVSLNNTVIDSTNANPIDGTGTVQLSNVVWKGTGSGVGTSAITSRKTLLGLARATYGSTTSAAFGYFDDEDTGFYRSSANTHVSIAGGEVIQTWKTNLAESQKLHSFYAGQTWNYATATGATFVVSDVSNFVVYFNTSTTTTIHLPDAPTAGRIFVLKDINDAGTIPLTITTPTGTVTIDNETSQQINVAKGSMTIHSDGTNYWII